MLKVSFKTQNVQVLMSEKTHVSCEHAQITETHTTSAHVVIKL